jgi:hypothetical protein
MFLVQSVEILHCGLNVRLLDLTAISMVPQIKYHPKTSEKGTVLVTDSEKMRSPHRQIFDTSFTPEIAKCDRIDLRLTITIEKPFLI